jgi:hypothetical protein
MMSAAPFFFSSVSIPLTSDATVKLTEQRVELNKIYSKAALVIRIVAQVSASKDSSSEVIPKPRYAEADLARLSLGVCPVDVIGFTMSFLSPIPPGGMTRPMTQMTQGVIAIKARVPWKKAKSDDVIELEEEEENEMYM